MKGTKETLYIFLILLVLLMLLSTFGGSIRQTENFNFEFAPVDVMAQSLPVPANTSLPSQSSTGSKVIAEQSEPLYVAPPPKTNDDDDGVGAYDDTSAYAAF